MTATTLRLNGEDNVAIAIDQVPQGATAAGITARQRVHKGHKMALVPIREGEPIKKFNQIIGFAKSHIAPGGAFRPSGRSLSWMTCSRPSSSSTDRSPSTGPSGALASPARSCS